MTDTSRKLGKKRKKDHETISTETSQEEKAQKGSGYSTGHRL